MWDRGGRLQGNWKRTQELYLLKPFEKISFQTSTSATLLINISEPHDTPHARIRPVMGARVSLTIRLVHLRVLKRATTILHLN